MLEKVIEIIIDQTCAPTSIHTSYIISFIIYLLEDEHELSLGMLIHLQRIYNYEVFMLLYYPSMMFYMHLYAILYDFWD